LRSWLRRFWEERDVQERNPITWVKPPPTTELLLPPVPLTDVDAMLNAADDSLNHAAALRNKAIVYTLRDTGVRAGELCAFDLADLTEATGSLVVRKSKTHGTRTVFLGQTARKAMHSWLRVRPRSATALFCTPKGKRLTYAGLREVLRGLATRAGVHVAGPHAFRRGFATEYYNAGGDLLSLARLLGHSGLGLVQRYAVHDVDNLRASHNARSPSDRV
jgi:site-specific recombinase XerD